MMPSVLTPYYSHIAVSWETPAMSSCDRLFRLRFRHALLPLALPMAGCEKIDGFWTWPGWTASGVAMTLTFGVIAAIFAYKNKKKTSGGTQIEVKGNNNLTVSGSGNVQINNTGGGNVGDVNSPKTTSNTQSDSGDQTATGNGNTQAKVAGNNNQTATGSGNVQINNTGGGNVGDVNSR
jgi:hypothetical protein